VGSVGTQNALELALAKDAKFFLALHEANATVIQKFHRSTKTTGDTSIPSGRAALRRSETLSESDDHGLPPLHEVDTHIVRIFNTYGPRMRLNDGRALPNFVFQALSGKPLTIYGDGKQTRSF